MAPPDRATFTAGVPPPDHVAVLITGAGPGDTALDLSFVAHDPAFTGGAPVAVE